MKKIQVTRATARPGEVPGEQKDFGAETVGERQAQVSQFWEKADERAYFYDGEYDDEQEEIMGQEPNQEQGAGEVKETADLLALLSESDRANVEAALVGNWDAIASFAYESFLSAGRGFVVLGVTGDDAEAAYLSWAEAKRPPFLLETSCDASTRALLEKLVPDYQPEQEFVAVIEFGGDSETNSLIAKISGATIVQNSQNGNFTLALERKTPKQAFESRR